MTKQDVEMTLLKMGEAMKIIVEAYAPEATQATVLMCDGNISVSACRYIKNGDYIPGILDATLFKDGDMRIGDKYIRAAGESE